MLEGRLVNGASLDTAVVVADNGATLLLRAEMARQMLPHALRDTAREHAAQRAKMEAQRAGAGPVTTAEVARAVHEARRTVAEPAEF